MQLPPILTTQSSGIGRGALKELIKKRSKDLKHQVANVGHEQGLSSKNQGVGAIPKKCGNAPTCGIVSTQQRQRSQSAPRQGGGASTSTGGANLTPAVQKGCYHPRHPADFRGEGKKDAHHMYRWHISITINTTAQEADTFIAPELRHMEWNRCRWHFVIEDDPLKYAVLLNDLFEEVHGYHLLNVDHYTEWIKPRGWCHKVILQREQLNLLQAPHGSRTPTGGCGEA